MSRGRVRSTNRGTRGSSTRNGSNVRSIPSTINAVARIACAPAEPVNPDKSTGTPNRTHTTGRRHIAHHTDDTNPFGAAYGNTRCAPHCATGTTGAPDNAAIRAVPVLPRSGHIHGSSPIRPSGYTNTTEFAFNAAAASGNACATRVVCRSTRICPDQRITGPTIGA